MEHEMNDTVKKSNSVLTWAIIDGKWNCTVLGVAKPIIFDPDKASAENRARAMMHGFKQRLADGAAIQRDTDTGASATPEEKAARIQLLADHYMSGSTDWAIRVAEPKAEGDGTWIAKALVALGKAPDIAAATALIQRFADKKHDGQLGPARKALGAAGDIKEKVLELKAAAVDSKVNSDDLLGELDESAPF
jgi:hypothetical protein